MQSPRETLTNETVTYHEAGLYSAVKHLTIAQKDGLTRNARYTCASAIRPHVIDVLYCTGHVCMLIYFQTLHEVVAMQYYGTCKHSSLRYGVSGGRPAQILIGLLTGLSQSR